MKREHFHTFDAFRFFAFFLVFLTHLPFRENEYFNLFNKSGGVGVLFFFVLSGFLITYILLHEKINNNENVNLKRFYLRRILRIWPLFYLMLLLAYLSPFIIEYFGFNSDNTGYKPNWLMSILFLENYMMMINNSPANVSPLGVMWTLCIEEHFYILWGILFYFFRTKYIPYVLGISIIFSNICRLILLNSPIYVNNLFIENFLDITTNLDYFAFGGLIAYLYVFRKSTIQSLRFIPIWKKYIICLSIISYIFISQNISYSFQNLTEPIIFSILFSLLISFSLINKNYIKINNNNIISKLGKYTYGLYLYHTIIIIFLLRFFEKNDIIINPISFSFISLLLSIIISILSYNIFERKFLKLKKRV